MSDRNGYRGVREQTQPALQLFVMDDDGNNVEHIGPLNLGTALHPVALKDGRVMFSSLETQGLRSDERWGIWAIHPDGTNWGPLTSALGSPPGQAVHFQTQLSDESIVVESYYQTGSTDGFGTYWKFPLHAPEGEASFGNGERQGTPFGLVGTSSLYKRESYPSGVVPTGSVTAVSATPTDRKRQWRELSVSRFGHPGNWGEQGADAGLYSNSDIWGIRILVLEPVSDAVFKERRHYALGSNAEERLRILGEFPVRKFNRVAFRSAKGPSFAERKTTEPLDPDGNPDTSFLAKIPADVAWTFQTLDNDDIASPPLDLDNERNVLEWCHQGKKVERDVDYTGSSMPPADAIAGKFKTPEGRIVRVPPLTSDEKQTFVRWIDLGCPIDSENVPAQRGRGWLLDEGRPTLTLATPEPGASNKPLTRILFGMHDYLAGLDADSLRVVADFTIDGIPPGENLAARFKPLPESRWQYALARPIANLTRGNLTVSVKDRQGNIATIKRTFSIAR